MKAGWNTFHPVFDRKRYDMNKKEIAELKKNFSEDSGLFVINRVVMAYVDAEKAVNCINAVNYTAMEPSQCEVVMETLRKVLSGTLGKNLTEYAFPQTSYEEGGAQKLLYTALRDGLNDEEIIKSFIGRIAENADIGSCYTVIAGLCTYSVPKKSKNDERLDDTDNDYSFIVTALCPANTGDDGLFYDKAQQVISKKLNTEMIIDKAPKDGFLFPVFSDRAADVNAVMYYSRSAKKPDLSIIEDVLDCTFAFTCDDEKTRFRALVSNICGEELNYGVVTQINDRVRELVDAGKNETEPPVVDAPRLKSILAEVGISDERTANVKGVYETIVGEFPLRASNLVENRTTVQADEISVNIGKDATDKVRTSVIGGRKCLVIDLEDPSVKVNGMETKIQGEE